MKKKIKLTTKKHMLQGLFRYCNRTANPVFSIKSSGYCNI